MNPTLLKNFRKLRDNPTYLSAAQAEMALRDARTITEFQSRDDVRIRTEAEQDNYFDVYGKPDNKKEYNSLCETLDNLGCYCVIAWQMADTISMCVYNDPASPWENCYVPELMHQALA